jgi:hypothetical protein
VIVRKIFWKLLSVIVFTGGVYFVSKHNFTLIVIPASQALNAYSKNDLLFHDPGGDYSVRILANQQKPKEVNGHHFRVQYQSSRSPGSLYGYVSNIARVGDSTAKLVAAQFNGFNKNSEGKASTWGIATEAATGDHDEVPLSEGNLVGGEFSVISQRHDQNSIVVGGDFVFKNKFSSSQKDEVLYGSAGENHFNKNSKAISISNGFNLDRSPSGAYNGWHRGIVFESFSLDTSVEGSPVGIDFSDLNSSRVMQAALKLRAGDKIAWNDDASQSLTVDQDNKLTYSGGAIHITCLSSAPKNPKSGDIVCANGTGWNPGKGGGFYGYFTGSWNKLH